MSQKDLIKLKIKDAISLHQEGQSSQGIALIKRLTQDIAEEDLPADVFTAWGLISQESDQCEAAETAFKKAIQKTKSPDNLINLAQCYLKNQKMYEAKAPIHEALAINSRHPRSLAAQAEFYWQTWEVEACIDTLREAVSLAPTNLDLVSQYLLCLNYSIRVNSKQIAKEHIEIGTALQQHFEKAEKISRSPIEGKLRKKIRIGLISPDFREHSVVYFLLSFLKHVDMRSFELFAYHTAKKQDVYTSKIKESVDHFRLLPLANFHEIRRDQLDVLIDLAGHTAGNAIPAFLKNEKVAPTYMQWLGYPNTSGYPLFDFRIVDPFTDPQSHLLERTAEKRAYLPACFLCYSAPDKVPSVSPLPALKDNHITFGCLNNLNKINDELIKVWAALLKQVKDSRLLLKSKAYQHEAVRNKIVQRFKKFGVDKDKLLLKEANESTFEHLETYHEIDIALDTFPYHGTTTTFEALLMGVPVVCLVGASHRSRVGASILQNLSKTEWIAETPLDYIKIATTIAADLPKLETERSQLRNILKKSRLYDGKGFAYDFEKVIKSVIKA